MSVRWKYLKPYVKQMGFFFQIRLLVLFNATWNHLTKCKKTMSRSFKNVSYKLFAYNIYIYIYIYIYIVTGRKLNHD